MISLEKYKNLKRNLDKRVNELIEETSDGNPSSKKNKIIRRKIKGYL